MPLKKLAYIPDVRLLGRWLSFLYSNNEPRLIKVLVSAKSCPVNCAGIFLAAVKHTSNSALSNEHLPISIKPRA